jgi:hypothetical protein
MLYSTRSVHAGGRAFEEVSKCSDPLSYLKVGGKSIDPSEYPEKALPATLSLVSWSYSRMLSRASAVGVYSTHTHTHTFIEGIGIGGILVN